MTQGSLLQALFFGCGYKLNGESAHAQELSAEVK